MTSEFVRLTPPESIYAEKNLLYSELEVLTSSKHLINYRSLKKEENQLKIILKQEIKTALDILKSVDKSLPKMKIPESELPSKIISSSPQEEKDVDSDELESELQRIKAKLSSLQSR